MDLYMYNFLLCFLGFELSTWTTEHGFTAGTTLPEYGVMQLLKDLDLAMYMKTSSCTPADTIYVNQTDGWQKGTMTDQTRVWQIKTHPSQK